MSNFSWHPPHSGNVDRAGSYCADKWMAKYVEVRGMESEDLLGYVPLDSDGI